MKNRIVITGIRVLYRGKGIAIYVRVCLIAYWAREHASQPTVMAKLIAENVKKNQRWYFSTLKS
jgi:hypothetical protein